MTDVIELDPSRRKPKPLPKPVVRESWEDQLLIGASSPRKNVANAALVLANAPEWKGSVSWDEFSERVMIVRACPAGKPGPWTDLADIETAIWLQRSRWKLEASVDLVSHAIRAVASSLSVHPLRERLKAMTWDGVERVNRWTSTYLGAVDSPVHQAIGRSWLLGAVARAFVPGCQVDAAIILEGAQGRGKSTALRILSLGYFTDELADVGSKDASMQLHGAWIVELSELDAISRVEATRVKSFVTRRTDRYRSPYGRNVAEHPRQCVFAGTTNQSDYLNDETGNRRWMPIECGFIDLTRLKLDHEQLWAEAVAIYRTGANTYISEKDTLVQISEHTAQRYRGDVWTDVVVSYAQVRESTSVAECLLHVGVERGRHSRGDEMRVSKILKSGGFERRKATVNGLRTWRYYPTSLAHVGSE